jgi:protein TonB
MFEQSLVESVHHFQPRRGWSTLGATVLQSFALALVIVLPLVRVQQITALSERMATPTMIAPAPQPLANYPAPPRSANDAITNALPLFRQPTTIPVNIYRGPDLQPPSIPLGRSCTANCIPQLGIPVSSAPPVLRAGTMSGPLIVSHLDPGQIVRQIQPTYPPIAKAAGIEGTVILRAVIERAGDIERLEVISGHPLLARAAREAVEQWKFRPYLLNGSAVEVETQITVNFRLNRE